VGFLTLYPSITHPEHWVRTLWSTNYCSRYKGFVSAGLTLLVGWLPWLMLDTTWKLSGCASMAQQVQFDRRLSMLEIFLTAPPKEDLKAVFAGTVLSSELSLRKLVGCVRFAFVEVMEDAQRRRCNCQSERCRVVGRLQWIKLNRKKRNRGAGHQEKRGY